MSRCHPKFEMYFRKMLNLKVLKFFKLKHTWARCTCMHNKLTELFMWCKSIYLIVIHWYNSKTLSTVIAKHSQRYMANSNAISFYTSIKVQKINGDCKTIAISDTVFVFHNLFFRRIWMDVFNSSCFFYIVCWRLISMNEISNSLKMCDVLLSSVLYIRWV